MAKIAAAEVRRAAHLGRLGCEIESFDELGSTNTEAAARARAGAPEGLLVLADAQSRGRGRLGRSWVSPPGRNLYASLVLRPPLPPAQVPLITLTAGLAVAETVAHWVGERTRIKWPNDVVVDGRKIAGILSEMDTDGGGVRFVIVGIGVNVNATAGDFPPEVRPLATSLWQCTGAAVDRAAVCARLLSRLELWYEALLQRGFSPIAAEWNRWDMLRGRQVQVQDGPRRIEGRVEGIGDDGRLRLLADAGVELIAAGDVTVLKAENLVATRI